MWSYCVGVFDSPTFDEELQVIGGDVLECVDNDRGGEYDEISLSESFGGSLVSSIFDSDNDIGGGN